ncbi:hypothetical protein GOP47_0002318 [Adiantum capillus-veneris]|uniref:Uncharacterized protein n=1 Tax=Adiantum capillus-veneris TaxID=13818 RepID=A0A9D4V9X4_ADICA|nr:hypothetical protein GOP47_0002318 [Adiantum capillus-veneris]
MKKKMDAGLLQSILAVASGPRPKQIEEHQKVKDHFLDMHLIKAHETDARLEEVEEVPTRSQKDTMRYIQSTTQFASSRERGCKSFSRRGASSRANKEGDNSSPRIVKIKRGIRQLSKL